jgi:signal transduction histidine kinase
LLDQVIQNLLSNAVKFTPEGTVIIGARTEEDGSVTCWVTDAGKGITPDNLERVDRKFFREQYNQETILRGLIEDVKKCES